jgi:hypothetical protein
MEEKVRLDEANKLFVLRALHEKARRDRKTRGFCRFGNWLQHEGRDCMVPDDFFSLWVKRFTHTVFKDYVDILYDEGLIEFFDAANREVFFEITEKGRIYLQNGFIA